jgi:hypothetical protein
MGDMSDPRAERAKQQMEQLQQRMKEAMKNATPEQRALIEQRMKLLKAGNQ